MRSRSRRAGLMAAGTLAGALVILLAGCTSMPTSGSVHDGRAVAVNPQVPEVRVLPPPPRPAAAVQDIVRGFLLASPTFEDSHRIARLYLTSDAQKSWRPETGVTVYDGGSTQYATSGNVVSVTVRQLATIDAAGRYLPLAEPRLLTRSFVLARDRTEWRISRPGDGLLLSTVDLARVYRHFRIYFLDPTQQVLVPELVLLPSQPGGATTLTKRLLAGPTRWLDPGVLTAFPEGTDLAVSSVQVEDGTAEVRLNDAANRATPNARQALSAQLVWTLRQLDEVRRVHITVDDTDYAVPGAGAQQGAEFWASYDPSVLGVTAPAYVERGGRLGRLDGQRFTPVPGPAGSGQVALQRPAVSIGGDLVAGLTNGGRTLVAGGLQPVTALIPQLSSPVAVGPPSFDRLDRLWTIDGRTGVIYAGPVGRLARVQVSGLTGAVVTQVRVARDGTRVALVARRTLPGGAARSELYVAVVQRGDTKAAPARLLGAHQIAPTLSAVADVAWLDAQRVVVLGAEPGGVRQSYTVDVDGYGITATTLPDPEHSLTIAAGPEPRPVLLGVVAATGQPSIWSTFGRSWVAGPLGTDPLYPG